MRLLLTSAGLTNTSIETAFAELLHKPFTESTITFIPTAANVEPGGKEWLIDNYKQLQKLQWKEFDIVDIAALTKERWLPRIEKADVLVVGGGNAYYLMHWMIESGLESMIPSLLKDKIYVGISAGSMITTKDFSISYTHDLEFYDEEVISEEEIASGLGLVDFHIIPHLNSDYFPKARVENIETFAVKSPDVLYALDDASAVKVVDGTISVVSEGTWKQFN